MVKHLITLLLAGPMFILLTLALGLCLFVIIPAVLCIFILLIMGEEDRAESLFCALGEFVFQYSPLALVLAGIAVLNKFRENHEH